MQKNLLKFYFIFRHPDQPTSHHGEAGLGLVRAVQSSHRSRRPRRGHQQEAVAGDHQGTQPAIIHNLGGVYTKDTVSLKN